MLVYFMYFLRGGEKDIEAKRKNLLVLIHSPKALNGVKVVSESISRSKPRSHT